MIKNDNETMNKVLEEAGFEMKSALVKVKEDLVKFPADYKKLAEEYKDNLVPYIEENYDGLKANLFPTQFIETISAVHMIDELLKHGEAILKEFPTLEEVEKFGYSDVIRFGAKITVLGSNTKDIMTMNRLISYYTEQAVVRAAEQKAEQQPENEQEAEQ